MSERWREIVNELEIAYFGCPFAEWGEQTDVGMWRDIVNDAAKRIEELESRVQRAIAIGHNDNCMFCGLKDKALLGEEEA